MDKLERQRRLFTCPNCNHVMLSKMDNPRCSKCNKCILPNKAVKKKNDKAIARTTISNTKKLSKSNLVCSNSNHLNNKVNDLLPGHYSCGETHGENHDIGFDNDFDNKATKSAISIDIVNTENTTLNNINTKTTTESNKSNHEYHVETGLYVILFLSLIVLLLFIFFTW